MKPDAIVIASDAWESFSASWHLRLKLDNRLALIQTVKSYIKNNGKVVNPIDGHKINNLHASYKHNGLVLFSYLTSKGYRVRLIDSFKGQRNRIEKILGEGPTVIIVSTTYICSKDALWRLVNNIRSVSPESYIIAGGPFVYSSYLLSRRTEDTDYDTESPENDYLFLGGDNEHDNVDLYIVSPGGLLTLVRTLEYIRKGMNPKELPNTAYYHDGKYKFSQLINEAISWNDLNVNWRDMPAEIFTSGVVSVAASYGCPFNCGFCNFIKDKTFTSVKPLNDLLNELRVLSDKGARYIRFIDDNFRLGKNDLNNVCKEFIREGFTFKWISFIRASTLRNTDMHLLRMAGCIGVHIGVESADQSVLRNMNKKADPEMYRKVIKAAMKAGIDCNCFFIAGFPGENEYTFNKTINFINEIQSDDEEGTFYWSMFPFILAPLSPIYEPESRMKYCLKGYMDTWEHSTMNSNVAKKLILKAYYEIDRSTPMYAGDNIEMLQQLPIAKRKEFLRLRHKLSKLPGNAEDRRLHLELFRNALDC